MRIGIDLTATWRPQTGLVVYALELSRALVEHFPEDTFVFYVQEPHERLSAANTVFRRSPSRNELYNRHVWLPTKAKADSLDVLHFPIFPPPMRPSRRSSIVMTVPDATVWLHPRTMRLTGRLYFRWLWQMWGRHASAICTYLDDTRRRLPTLINCQLERVVVTPLAARTLPPPMAGDQVFEAPYLLTVATLEPRKNLQVVLDALDLLRSAGLSIPLVIAGRSGWKQTALEAQLHRRRDITYVGHVPDAQLASLYRTARLFVAPSIYEGFGLTPVEAAMSGCAAIVSDIAAHREVFGVDAPYFDPHSAISLATTIRNLWTDEDARQRLAGQQGRAASTLSWAVTARATREAYARTSVS